MNLEIVVTGMVQGIGYRPFVRSLADGLGLSGVVRNSGGFVTILVSGEKAVLQTFLDELTTNCPPGALITGIHVLEKADADIPAATGFLIAPSTTASSFIPIPTADIALCDSCAREMKDPSDRRFRHPFISCASCGPRYSILHALPYDRESVTMQAFIMCDACRDEYQKDGRRRHAQTISCHDCGPQLLLKTQSTLTSKEAALEEAVRLLKAGQVLAVKGVGGYQLVCTAESAESADAIRAYKNRDKKPFAVMFPDIQSIKSMCAVSAKEEALLKDPARPIVLLSPLHPCFSGSVNGDSRFLGAFLPYTGLHQLLTDACGPLVVTSYNISDDPILFRDEDIPHPSDGVPAAILYHEREIVTPLDDSVVRVTCDRTQFIRRSRGYVPTPIFLKKTSSKVIFATGGDLKSTFCLLAGGYAFLSQYFGDLDSYAVQQNYRTEYLRMTHLLGLTPDIIVKDIHPGYQSGAMVDPALERSTDEMIPEIIAVQHHHAHIASVMAEHDLPSCIGVAFDGTGYGTDGHIWGGEFLLVDKSTFTRESHLSYVRIVGGDDAVRRPDTVAYCYLAATGEDMRHEDSDLLRAALRNKTLTVKTSSMGRLFDAVSCVLEFSERNTFEGESAILLENAAAEAVAAEVAPFALHFSRAREKDEGMPDAAAIVRDIRYAYITGIDRRALAYAFHAAIAEMTVQECEKIRSKSGENRVAIAGGVFANVLLTGLVIKELETNGFLVYQNELVPPNDGSISLGQAYIAMLRKEER